MRKNVLLSGALLMFISSLTLVGCKKDKSHDDESETAQVEATNPTSPISVLTYNVRYDNPGDDNNNWGRRLPKVNAFLDSIASDVIGAQEVLHNQLGDLLAAHPGYDYYGVGREDGKEKGEYQPLFWKKERFELVDKGHFWLSETPEKPSHGWDAACERTAVWAKLQDKLSGRAYLFMNTHLDHVGEKARANGVRMLKERARILSGDSLEIVITGDFNADPSSSVILDMLDGGLLRNARSVASEVSGPEWSYHDFGKLPLPERPLIDYVFVSSDGSDVLSSSVLAEEDQDKGHIYLSDHAPILVKLSTKKAR